MICRYRKVDSSGKRKNRKDWRRGRDSLPTLSGKSWRSLWLAILACVYASVEHIRNLGCCFHSFPYCPGFHGNRITGISVMFFFVVFRWRGAIPNCEALCDRGSEYNRDVSPTITMAVSDQSANPRASGNHKHRRHPNEIKRKRNKNSAGGEYDFSPSVQLELPVK